MASRSGDAGKPKTGRAARDARKTRAKPRRARRGGAAAPVEPVDQSGRPLGPRAQKTRQRLLEATEDLLRERGLREISVVEIARTVGTSPATFYQYFRDVPEAVLRLSEQALEDVPDLVAWIDGSWSGRQGLEAARGLVDAFIRHWDAHHAVLRVRNLASEEGERRFQRARHAAIRPVMDQLAARLREAQAAGRVSPQLHPYAAAAALASILERLSAFHQELEYFGVKREDIVETSARILHQVVTGRSA